MGNAGAILWLFMSHLCQAHALTDPGHPGGPLPRSSALASTNTGGDIEVRVTGPEAGCQHGVDLDSLLRSLSSWASELRRFGVVDKPCEGRRGWSRAMEQQSAGLKHSRTQTISSSSPRGQPCPGCHRNYRPSMGACTHKEMHSKQSSCADHRVGEDGPQNRHCLLNSDLRGQRPPACVFSGCPEGKGAGALPHRDMYLPVHTHLPWEAVSCMPAQCG